MANWCLNTVTFEADETVMEKIRVLFLEMAEREILYFRGQMPPFYRREHGYLFEIDWREQELFYLTKWSPNIDVMIAVADHYHACFVYTYEELAMGIYGMAIYRWGRLWDIYLEPDDFTQFSYFEQADKYEFEGKHYTNEFEVLDILLQRKVDRIYKQ
ncbi:MAG: hypothetical protein P0Y49_04790 [Candidatus Pedobacter colombiensis]|uniref:YubB ferredoxin-like domain-containing protein n=1 Tax=Candidatus Pedobacter colombiensis TaxID=3121371 RepID=A0AAJ5W8A0_9SPHI|nr:hypothetical protein [Pedobacter sp.]WEK20453.1 MAG: hypothetical protein P0Y49_04790 [Pedobacter sp.]